MPLVRQDKEIPLNGGLNTKVSDAFQDASTATQVTNLRHDSIGELVKRPATATQALVEVPPSTIYTSAQCETLFTCDDEVCALTGDFGVARVNAQDPTEVLWTGKESGIGVDTPVGFLKYAPKACKVSRNIVDSAQYTNISQGVGQVTSVVISGGIQVIAWSNDSPGAVTDRTVRMKSIDVATGRVLATTQVLTASARVWSVQACEIIDGDYGALIAVTTGASAPFTVSAYLYDRVTHEFSDAGALTGNAGSTAVHVRSTRNVGQYFYLAYQNNTTGFATVELRTVFTVASSHVASVACNSGIAVVPGTTRVLIAMATPTTVYVDVYGTPTATSAMTSGAGESFYGLALGIQSDGTSAVLFANCIRATFPSHTRIQHVNTIFTATTPTFDAVGATPNCWLAGSPFLVQGRVYVPISPRIRFATLDTVFLFRYTRHSVTTYYLEPVARLCHERYYSLAAGIFGQTTTSGVVGNTAHMTFTGDTSAEGYPQTVFHSIVEFPETDESLPLPYTQVDQVTYVGSGLVFDWDGETPTESSPLIAPYIELDTSSGTGVTCTNIAFVAKWRWIDSHGNLHESAPSNVAETGALVDKQIDVYVRKLPFVSYGPRGPLAEVELYGTDDLGVTYHLVTASGIKVFPSSYSDHHWKFTAVTGAGGVQLRSLGTGGSELVPTPPPPPRDIAKIGDRLWIIDAEDPTRLWYSKPFVPGYAVEWNNTQTITIGAEGVAIRENSGIVAVLAKDSVWAIEGSGPDALGNGSFGIPRKTSSVGCIDTTGVCKTPMGVVFRSLRGYQLLDRGFNVQPFGLPIEQDTRITSAQDYAPGRIVYDDMSQEVRILDLEGATQWVFNARDGKWSRFTTDVPLDLAQTQDGTWIIDLANGVSRETTLAETPAASTGEWIYQTPWLTLNGLQGFGRVWELVLQVRLRTDVANSSIDVTYETREPNGAGSEPFSWSGAQLEALLYGANPSDLVDLRIKPKQQKCKAFRLTISSSSDSPYVGSSPISLRLIYGADKSVKATRTTALRGPNFVS